MKMRTVFVLSFAANVLLAVASLWILPPEVAIHFGSGGRPDGWAPSWLNTALFLGLDVLLFGSLYFTPHLISKTPARWMNLPHKGYWLRPENRPRAAAKMSSYVYQLGTAVFLFLLLTGVFVIEANLARPVRLREELFLPALVAFMAYTVGWCVALYRSFRVPKGGESGR